MLIPFSYGKVLANTAANLFLFSFFTVYCWGKK